MKYSLRVEANFNLPGLSEGAEEDTRPMTKDPSVIEAGSAYRGRTDCSDCRESTWTRFKSHSWSSTSIEMERSVVDRSIVRAANSV